MARDARSRYQTAAELSADLRRFLDGTRPLAADALARASAQEQWSASLAGVSALAASPGGRFIAVGLASGSIELREADSGALVASYAGHSTPVVALAFTGDRVVAAWAEGHVATVTFPGDRS